MEETPSARQERLEKFIQHLEEARQLQRDWMNYGLECVDSYVEDVEEDVLCLFLVGKELDIVHDQHVDELVEVYEVVDRVVLDSVEELVGKLLR